ncbi:OST1 [Candida pseudojiufengensis]|uniref:OST1 n=1 Tax=Candida pseudojiufengensis TaxID=497109 RepID=UPI002223F1E1|nr:OST1 [Candida pseudojiufengensis]KAI5959503.1 OST1 [Candida pseudojiufengensis]
MLRQFILSIGLILSICIASQSLYTFSPDWENTHYMRTIDLSKSYVKETDLIDIKNIATTPLKEYIYTINDGFDSVDNLSMISFQLNDQLIEIPFEIIVPNKIYKLKLPLPVSPNSNLEIKVNYVYINQLKSIPSKIKLEDTQQLLFKTNKFPFSPYVTKDYTMSLTGMSKGQEMDLNIDDKVNSTENVPVLEPRVDNQSLKYGPLIEDLHPFTLKPMGLMYDHNRPLTEVINLNRSIWLPGSNVNKVSIEEYYELTNSGAQLSSGFSRVDWMKGRYEGTRNHWALSHLEFPLVNRDLDDYYYTDKVGVVSSHKKISNHLLLSPRFPIFGGWHYNFTLGWSENLNNFIHKINNDEYIIKFPILNTLRDTVYDNVYLEFYLPEGSIFEDVVSPIPYTDVTVSNELSYFDVSKGHVKVTIHYKDLFDDIFKLEVFLKYKYETVNIFIKIGKISGFVFIGLMSYYFLNLL